MPPKPAGKGKVEDTPPVSVQDCQPVPSAKHVVLTVCPARSLLHKQAQANFTSKRALPMMVSG